MNANLKIHYPNETSTLQEIMIDFTGIYSLQKKPEILADVIDYAKIEKEIIDIVKNNQFDIIEALAVRIIDEIFAKFEILDEISLKITKNAVLKYTKSVSVEFSERRNKCKVILALGSNLGDRSANISNAINQIKQVFNLKDIKVSKFHEFRAELSDLAPKEWHLDFINTAISFEITQNYDILLEKVIQIQHHINDNKKVTKDSPRIIDIDIIYYAGKIISKSDLQIPHKDCYFRDFVLIPASEIEPELVICCNETVADIP